MIYEDYIEGAVLAADLVNSLGSVSGRENLPDPDSLRSFLRGRGLDTPTELTEEDLMSVKRLRARLREAFFAPSEEETARVLNSLFEGCVSVPQLIERDGRWDLQFWKEDAPISERIATIAAAGLAGTLQESGRGRFGSCNADDCADVFIDTSKNRSRRYCMDSCSSRTNVKAFRARQRA